MSLVELEGEFARTQRLGESALLLKRRQIIPVGSKSQREVNTPFCFFNSYRAAPLELPSLQD